MALDHFVSQVHLKKFCAPDLGHRQMFAFRKSNGQEFPCGSRDVCRIDEGSTNTFLTEPRLLEDFLKIIEPNYTRACDNLATGTFSHQDVFVIAGFATFVIGCSPTAMRLGASSLSHLANAEMLLMEAMGELDPIPPELGATSIGELLSSGTLKVETDPKFPQAMGIAGIVSLASAFASYHWEILKNPYVHGGSRMPFLTCDFPAALENSELIPTNRVVPLRPDLAIRIIPQIRPPEVSDRPEDFRFRIKTLSPSEVRAINRTIVRSAEDFVFSPIRTAGLARMVRQNATYGLELVHDRISRGTGYYLLNSVRVVDRKEFSHDKP